MEQLKWSRNETYIVKVGRLIQVRSNAGNKLTGKETPGSGPKIQTVHCVIATLGMVCSLTTIMNVLTEIYFDSFIYSLFI